MSHKITLEEEKIVGASYAYRSQESIRKLRKHGRNQIIRILQPKNLAFLLYHETQLHDLTKYANKHLQERLKTDVKLFFLIFVLSVINLLGVIFL